MNQVLKVTDIFQVTGRGCVIVGIIKEGVFHKGDPVNVMRDNDVVKLTTISAIEMINYGSVNTERRDTIGLILNDIQKNDVMAGDTIING